MVLSDVAMCGARTRVGGNCRQPAMRPSGRCHMHGGKTPRGLANPNTKTGRYSRDLPTRLGERYADLMEDGELLSVRDNIALIRSAIGQTLAEIREAEEKPDPEPFIAAAERIADNWQTWDRTRMQREMQAMIDSAKGTLARRDAFDRVQSLIRDKSVLIQQENQLLRDRDAMIPVDQVLLLMRALSSVVRRAVRDPEMLRTIEVEFTRIATNGRSLPPGPRDGGQ